MADNLTKEQRSRIMSRIKGRDTKPELVIKPLMRKLGFLYQPKMYGRPDFANKRMKIAVFVDGCFWHGCPGHYKAPKQNAAYWKAKVANNRRRDKTVNSKLKGRGWKVVRIWEHDIKRNSTKNLDKILNRINIV